MLNVHHTYIIVKETASNSKISKTR